jgi:UDP-N-acetylglucosamine 4,6-dehydratase/5-epimerase
MFEDKTILITGGTGSLGRALTKKLLEFPVKSIRIFSRDEWKQHEMKSTFMNKKLRFLIGDIRDKERLSRSLEDVDIVIHAAALKQVPIIEYNPMEAVKTNVNGAQNLIECCLDQNVKIVLAVGTDKAVSPLNTYGATKLLMERLFVSANNFKGSHDTKFLCVRYGNVMGSRGSIIPILINQINTGKKFTITDPTMTRFNITMDAALELIFRALKNGIGGDVYVPKLKSYLVDDLTNAVSELTNLKNEIEIIGIRPGEKLHEILISEDEIRNTFETKDDYVIFDQTNLNTPNLHSTFSKSKMTCKYSSDNVELLSIEQLKNIIKSQKLL